MAVGDLVTGVGAQYEFANILFGTNSSPIIVVDKVDGLDSMPDIRKEDIERNDTHGDVTGVDLLASRVIDMDVDISSPSHAAALSALRSLGLAMRPLRTTALQQFVFQRPGEPKRFVWAKPRRKDFPSNYELSQGLGKGKLQWYAPDPRIYSMVENVTDIVIAASTSSASGTVTNGGDFEMFPVLEIIGEGTNPRVTNNTLGRAVRFDLTMAAGDTLRLDFARKTATLNGAEAYQFKRGDNQWWDLLAGGNSVTVSRGNAPVGTQTFRFRHRDAWV